MAVTKRVRTVGIWVTKMVFSVMLEDSIAVEPGLILFLLNKVVAPI